MNYGNKSLDRIAYHRWSITTTYSKCREKKNQKTLCRSFHEEESTNINVWQLSFCLFIFFCVVFRLQATIIFITCATIDARFYLIIAIWILFRRQYFCQKENPCLSLFEIHINIRTAHYITIYSIANGIETPSAWHCSLKDNNRNSELSFCLHSCKLCLHPESILRLLEIKSVLMFCNNLQLNWWCVSSNMTRGIERFSSFNVVISSVQLNCTIHDSLEVVTWIEFITTIN